MYFTHITALKKAHSERRFADYEVLPYVLLYIGISTLMLEFMPHTVEEETNIWTYVLSSISVLMSVFGTIYAYHCNGGRKGDNFANKYFSVGFVVGIRMLALLLPIIVVLMVYWNAKFGDQITIPTTWFEVMLYSIWLALFYFMLGKYIGEIAASQKAE